MSDGGLVSSPRPPHLNGNPNLGSVPLVPPALLRTRVVSPAELLRVEAAADATFQAISSRADAVASDPRVAQWVAEVLAMQEGGIVPPAPQEIMRIHAAFGLAAALLEESWGWAVPERTAELIQDALAVVSFDDDPADGLIKAIAADGAYYMARTGHSASAVAASMSAAR